MAGAAQACSPLLHTHQLQHLEPQTQRWPQPLTSSSYWFNHDGRSRSEPFHTHTQQGWPNPFTFALIQSQTAGAAQSPAHLFFTLTSARTQRWPEPLTSQLTFSSHSQVPELNDGQSHSPLSSPFLHTHTLQHLEPQTQDGRSLTSSVQSFSQ